ncbi:MAG: V-type ATP synthase subunit D [Thermoplasmatales archaeon]|jgi:V/A-type H+-transporting ATPase subunit D|nr:V-type ATP synthase subunit D [Thermoplasmatales archaeon]MCK4995322.1 V-type ATP synthase subunit D [Thermoplasmatales archaeon]MCK5636262.1 V-type ATP synthase subunit D [Thermoplasmatales archaeon]
MAEQILEGVSPTRMDLLETRKKLVLAEKGHKLLEEKRDALVEKFFDIIDKRNQLSKGLDEEFKGAFLSLIQAQMILGEKKVEEASFLNEDIGEISFETDNIMGVKIPKMNTDEIKTDLKPAYGFFETCSKLDDSKKSFSRLLIKLIELADLEAGIKSLTVEIEKTKRRVNVLENNLIPKLHATRKYIEMQLEEREREDFFRRKRIKAILESKKV